MEVETLNPEEIEVGERFRKDFSAPELNALAESIRQLGQLQPIGVVRAEEGAAKPFKLVYGHRRLLACQRLKEKVKALVLPLKGGLNEKVAEFAENAVRKDFSPIEKSEAVKALHEALKKEHPNWTVEKTGSFLGLSRSYIQELLKIASYTDNADETEKAALKDLTMRELRTATGKKGQIERILNSVLEMKKAGGETLLHFQQGNAFELPFPKHHFQLILTDPPYGISYEKKTSLDKDHINFKDDQDAAWFTRLWQLFDRLADPAASCILSFCSVENFVLFRTLATEFGFKPYPRPLVWIKAAAGQPFQAKYFPTSCTEFALYAVKGDFEVLRAGHPDWFSVPRLQGNDRFHPTQKPIQLWEQILNWLALPSYSLIDPFAGSGSSLIAAKKAGLKEVWGAELNPDFYRLANEYIRRSCGLQTGITEGQTSEASSAKAGSDA